MKSEKEDPLDAVAALLCKKTLGDLLLEAEAQPGMAFTAIRASRSGQRVMFFLATTNPKTIRILEKVFVHEKNANEK